jgi:DNA-binding response OmpR family regulator
LNYFLKIIRGRAEQVIAVSFPVSSQLDRRVQDDGRSESPGGLVLLAVEEPSIARMLARVIKKAGMNVLWTGGYAQSLDWLRNRPLEATHLFVDCPGLGDDVVEFTRNAVALRPNLQILLAGGRDISELVETLSECASAVHVPKPYLPTELAWQLRSPDRRHPE